MRKQYFFAPSPRGLLAWDVDRLAALSAGFARQRVSLATLRELDEPFLEDGRAPTAREIAGHMKLVDAADLAFPIILSASGAIMDGRHRCVKALMLGHTDINAVRFERDPEPDHIGKGPDELDY